MGACCELSCVTDTFEPDAARTHNPLLVGLCALHQLIPLPGQLSQVVLKPNPALVICLDVCSTSMPLPAGWGPMTAEQSCMLHAAVLHHTVAAAGLSQAPTLGGGNSQAILHCCHACMSGERTFF